jgi:hypothetical protein
MYIYVLLLKNYKYYVGKTNDLHTRYRSHKSGHGAYWTELYKPISMICNYEVSNHTSSLEETILTFQLMLRHGINHVRGAEYCQPVLYDKSAVRRIRFSMKHHLYLRKTDSLCGCGDIKILKEFKCPKCLYIDTQPVLKLRNYIEEYRDVANRNSNFKKIVMYILLNDFTQILPELHSTLLAEIRSLLQILKTLILLVVGLTHFRYKSIVDV